MSYSHLLSNQDELTPPATPESTQPATAKRDRPSTTKSESKLYLETPEDFVNSVKHHAKQLRADFHIKLNSVKTVRKITYSAKPYRTYKKRSDQKTTTDEQPQLQPVTYPISTQETDSNKPEGPNQLDEQTSITFISPFHPHLTEERQDPLPEQRHDKAHFPNNATRKDGQIQHSNKQRRTCSPKPDSNHHPTAIFTDDPRIHLRQTTNFLFFRENIILD
ncbi:hypothetical protein DPMN_096742 [Dreissena polymorpha]|uniref:Uncharacterized protein n=1 Tax=Dreissena polymorpha TaxID=45954 RepID=A0A9D4R4S0_DREPO|nr:hypothetical protein DPMN_096742 [Dreissena polymorpha]